MQPQRLGGRHDGPSVAIGQRLNEPVHIAAVDAAQHLLHVRAVQHASAKCDRLIGQRQRVAHRSARGAREQAQRLRIDAHAFVVQHPRQVLAYRLGRHRSQVELQTTRQHRHRNLLRIGGCQHKLQVRRRLLERLQHRVEGRRRQHMHLVNHEHLEAPLHRLVDRLLEQALHIVDAAVGGGVELGVVDETTRIDVGARLADAARRRRHTAVAVGAQAVQRFGQDARHRRLANAPGAGEQIGVVQSLRVQRVGQRTHHMLLADHFREILRAVLAGEHEVGHSAILVPCPRRQNRRQSHAPSCAAAAPGRTILSDGPSRMVKRPTGSGGEPSSPNCGASAGVKARQPHSESCLQSRT